MLPARTTNAEFTRTIQIIKGILYSNFRDFKNIGLGSPHNGAEEDKEDNQADIEVHWAGATEVSADGSKTETLIIMN